MEIKQMLFKNVLVKLDEEKNTTESGLILSKNTKLYNTGTVVKALTNAYVKDGQPVVPQLKENDRVLLYKAQGFEIEINNEKLLLIEEDKIVCIIS